MTEVSNWNCIWFWSVSFFTYLTYFSFICFSSRPFSPIDCMMNSHSVSVCLVVFLPSSMCTSSPSLFSIPILCQRTCSFFSSCFHRFVVSSSRFPLPHLVPSSFFLLVVALLFLLHLSSSFFFLFPDSLFPHVLISCFKYTTERVYRDRNLDEKWKLIKIIVLLLLEKKKISMNPMFGLLFSSPSILCSFFYSSFLGNNFTSLLFVSSLSLIWQYFSSSTYPFSLLLLTNSPQRPSFLFLSYDYNMDFEFDWEIFLFWNTDLREPNMRFYRFIHWTGRLSNK